jgi:protoheme IX farnesyltransferase
VTPGPSTATSEPRTGGVLPATAPGADRGVSTGDLATAGVGSAAGPLRTGGWRASLGAYVALTKPRIIELLLVVTIPVMFLAARGVPPLLTVLWTLVGGALAAGSANALNCYLDRDIDQEMARTRKRPLPTHSVSPRRAAVFGVVLGLVAVVGMAVVVNVLSALLTLAAIVFYLVVYTALLKRRTWQNVVWGGIAGCFPALIGWTAVTGALAWPPVVLFAVVFLWTPPHTWALGMRYRADYAAAGVPMLPVVAGPRRVARQVLLYSVATVAVSLLLWPVAHTTPLYPVVALVAGGWLIGEAVGLSRRAARVVAAGGTGPAANLDPSLRPMRLFHATNVHLAVVFLAVAVDALLR